MSQQNIDVFNRAIKAYNRRDVEALLDELDPAVEWHPALEVLLRGEATVYRGHQGVRELLLSTDETLGTIHVEFSRIEDLGDRVIAIGRLRTRGKESGAETESPLGLLAKYKSGRAVQVRTYLDPKEALEVAGLRE